MILTLALATALAAPVPGALPVPGVAPVGLSCSGWSTSAETGADYYAIELVPTGRVPGTRLSKGVAYQAAAVSPFFGVALAPTGEYLHDLDIQVGGLRPLESGAYVAWVTDPDVAQIERLGALDDNLHTRGRVRWNKFLVVITREASDQPSDTWQGPIIMRGMSRSGRMHTMAGHGPYQTEPCAKYGFR